MDKTLIGVSMMTISMIAYGITNPILKKAGFNPFATAFIQIAALWLAILPFFIFSKSFQNIISRKESIYLLIIAGLINAFGYYLFVKSFEYLPIWQINLFWVLMPLFGGIAGYYILGEALTIKFFIGLTITMIGLFIAIR